MNIAQLQNEFPAKSLPPLVTSIQRAIQLSIKRHPLRLSISDTEIKRRIAWCCSQAVMLRRVMIWSNERICDTLPQALDTYLTTGDWQPSTARSWSA